MGYLFLLLSKLSGIGKMIAMKKCGKIAAGPENSLIINMLRTSGCLIISLAVSFAVGFGSMSQTGFLISILFGIFVALSLFSWVLAAECSSLCVVEIFCMIGGVLVPLTITPLFIPSEPVGIFSWVGALLLIPAALLLFPKSEKALSLKALPILIFAGLANAGGVITQKLFAEYGSGSATDFNTVSFAVALPMLLLIYTVLKVIRKNTNQKRINVANFNKQIIVYIIIAIAMLYCAQYTNTLAAGKLSGAILFPLSYAIGMPLTMLADIVVFKEKLRIKTVCGVSLAVLSAILCNL